MSASRVLWGQIVLVLAIMLLSWWAATEWTAWRLGFQPELGPPWFMLDHRWPVYAPALFFWWWYEFDAYAPAIFVRGARIAALHQHVLTPFAGNAHIVPEPGIDDVRWPARHQPPIQPCRPIRHDLGVEIETRQHANGKLFRAARVIGRRPFHIIAGDLPSPLLDPLDDASTA